MRLSRRSVAGGLVGFGALTALAGLNACAGKLDNPNASVLRMPKWPELPGTQDILEKREDLYSIPYHAFKKYGRPQWIGERKFRDLMLAAHNVVTTAGTFRIGFWPHGAKGAVNVQFDDFCPRSRTTANVDNGGEPNRGVNRPIMSFLARHPAARMTIFTIPDAAASAKQEGLYTLTNPRNKVWVDWVREDMLSSGQVEIADHGLHHETSKPGVKLPAAEYNYDSMAKIVTSLTRARNIFAEVDLPVTGMRPPGWGLGKRGALIAALRSMGAWDYMASSTVNAGLNYGEKRASYLYPQEFEGILNLPQNLTIDIPKDQMASYAPQLIAVNALLTLKGHYDDLAAAINDISPRNMANLEDAFTMLERGYGSQLWYATLSDIARFWAAKDGLTFRAEPTDQRLMLRIHNTSRHPLGGLTIEAWPGEFRPMATPNNGHISIDIAPGSEGIVTFIRR